MIAPVFIGGGVDALVHPGAKAVAAERLSEQLAGYGVPDDPLRLVRLNGGVQLLAGSLLVLVPTTLAGHRFWEETDSTVKAAQRVQLMKNLAMLGGLLLAATDRDGSPSLTWRAKRAANSTKALIGSAASSMGDHFSPESKLVDRALTLSDRTVAAAGPLLERATKFAGLS
jgi:putative oxidoreductase